MNLSDITLTQQEIAILNKDLTFIPTPTWKMKSPQEAISLHKQRLRLEYLYQDTANDLNPFKKKSQYTPITSGNSALENYLSNTETAILAHCMTPQHKIKKQPHEIREKPSKP